MREVTAFTNTGCSMELFQQQLLLTLALLVYLGKETTEAPSSPLYKRAVSKSDYDEQFQEFLKDLNTQDDDAKDPFSADNLKPAVETPKPIIIDKSSSDSFKNTDDLDSTISEIFGSKDSPKKGSGDELHEAINRVFGNNPSPNEQTQSIQEHKNIHHDFKGSSGGPVFDLGGPKKEELFNAPHTHFGNSNLGGPINEPNRGQLFNGPNRENDMNFGTHSYHDGSKKEETFKAPHRHGGTHFGNSNLGGPINEQPNRGQLFNGPNRENDRNFGTHSYYDGPNKEEIFKEPHTEGGNHIHRPNLGGSINEELSGPNRRPNDMNFGTHHYRDGPKREEIFNPPHTQGGMNIHRPNLGGPINEEFIKGPRRGHFNEPNMIGDLPHYPDGPKEGEIVEGPNGESDTNGGILSLGGLIKDIFNGLKRPMETGHEDLPINTLQTQKEDLTMSDILRDFAQRMKKMWHENAGLFF
ncbi:unnamed protein product [Phyllotreta striolata]|uniref:Uncharacterized protein n=1 Tax=Phyllotreta striolata TaxID=444603 RepID=A0A9N9TLZ2_PHYSR|nr:unnamed protein product [Phyllotreta striolata]